jgi:mono/diheme cytochrome c family protein
MKIKKQSLFTTSRFLLMLGLGVTLLSLGLSLNARVSAQSIIPTYYRDVQPILEKNCVSCHVKGGIAPFALDDPKEATARAERIMQVTQVGYMPPYPPSQDSQPFLNERRLGTASKQILADWAKAGAPLGTPPKK